MNKQELEELFPIGCVISQDIKEKIDFGEWKRIWYYEFPNEAKFPKSGNNLSPKHILDIESLPTHSFGAAARSQPILRHSVSYKRIG